MVVRSGAVVESLDRRRLMADAFSASINGSQTFQSIDAIGAAIASQSQFSGYRQASFYNTLVSDLGLTAVRSALEPGWEAVNDNGDPNVTDLTKFNDAAISNTMQFFQQMKARGVTTFLLSVFSPPAWMKTNKATANGGQLRPDLRNEFAEYVTAAVLQAKQKYGVDITQVSLANEPWFTEPFNSNVWTPIEMRETVKAVAARFKLAGLTTQLVAPEEVSSIYRETTYLNAIANDPVADAAVPIWGTHYLNEQDGKTLAANAAADGKKVWYTEVGDGTADIDGAIGLARGIDSAIVKGNAAAWFNWQITGSYSFEALMNGTTPNVKYYALKQFAHFVRPGAVRIGTNYTGSTVRVAAFKQPSNGAISIVLSNARTTDVQATLSLAGLNLPANFRQFRTSATENCVQLASIAGTSTITVTLPANSIVTLYAGPDLPVVTNTTAASLVPQAPLIDSSTTNSLRFAALRGDLNTVNSLIAGGADVNAAYSNGWTPLFEAAASSYNKSDQIITALLNAGADPQHRDSEGMTALHVAAMSAIPSFGTDPKIAVKRLNLLLAAGINVNTLDNLGRTALHYTAMLPKLLGNMLHSDPEPIQTLLGAGADASIKDNFGKTAKDYAIAAGFPEGVAAFSAPGNLSVVAFADSNHNGVRDGAEAVLPNVTVLLDLDNDGVQDANESTQITNNAGVALFANLLIGSYGVVPLTTPANYTAPAEATFIVNSNSTTSAPLPFAPIGTSAISGSVFNDVNKDGKWMSGEAGIVGRTVWIDTDADGTLDAGEPTQTTASGGKYLFGSLTAGTYTIREVLPAGWTQTQPTQNGAFVVSIGNNFTKSGNDFGTFNGGSPPPPPPPPPPGTASIRAYVVRDKNMDGKWSSGEVGVAGRTVWMDLDNDGTIDANETTTTTLSNGSFNYTGLAAGTYYFRQVLPAGAKQTYPANNGPLVITVAAGQAKSGNSMGTV